MSMHKATPVPNLLFDSMIPHFKEAELKVFLIIIRKTMGWYDARTGQRKVRDWIALSQFIRFTGLSNVSVWKAVDSLAQRQYILVTDAVGNVLNGAAERQGKKKLFYQVNPELLNIIR